MDLRGWFRMQKVLLVEDEELERVFLKRLFQTKLSGYQVIGEAPPGDLPVPESSGGVHIHFVNLQRPDASPRSLRHDLLLLS